MVTAALVTVALLLATVAEAQQHTRARPLQAVEPVPLTAVRLLPNAEAYGNAAVYIRQQHNLAYLVALNVTRLACPFVQTAGLNRSVPCVDYTENKGHW